MRTRSCRVTREYELVCCLATCAHAPARARAQLVSRHYYMCKCFKICWSPKPFVLIAITFVLVSKLICPIIYSVGGGSAAGSTVAHCWSSVPVILYTHLLLPLFVSYSLLVVVLCCVVFAVLFSRCDGFVHCSSLRSIARLCCALFSLWWLRSL